MRTTLLLLLTALLAAPMVSAAESPQDASPLAAYPGFGHDPKADDDQFAREERAREELVVRCMEREGFIYHSTTSVALDDYPTASDAMAAMRDDPNGRVYRRLAAEDQPRYLMALHGTETPFSELASDHPDPADDSAGGCRGEALRALPGVFAAKASLQEALDEMRRAVQGDPKLKAAEARWARCMQKRGHDLDDSPRALELRQDAELATLVGLTKATMPKKEVIQALGRTHHAERQLTMQCALKVDLPGAAAKVRTAHEALFVLQHRETLDRHHQQLLAQQPLLEDIEANLP